MTLAFGVDAMTSTAHKVSVLDNGTLVIFVLIGVVGLCLYIARYAVRRMEEISQSYFSHLKEGDKSNREVLTRCTDVLERVLKRLDKLENADRKQ